MTEALAVAISAANLILAGLCTFIWLYLRSEARWAWLERLRGDDWEGS